MSLVRFRRSAVYNQALKSENLRTAIGEPIAERGHVVESPPRLPNSWGEEEGKNEREARWESNEGVEVQFERGRVVVGRDGL